MIRQYKKLKVPEDTAWDRKTWRRYAPVWLKDFVDGVTNLVYWLPAVWKDRHWDSYYILRILQRKIELQRDYIVSHNRHQDVPQDNRDMTIVLNLLERKMHDYYGVEYMDYEDSELSFKPIEGEDQKLYTIEVEVQSERYDEYINKYKSTARLVRNIYNEDKICDKGNFCRLIARHNQYKSEKLLWDIMKTRSHRWWD